MCEALTDCRKCDGCGPAVAILTPAAVVWNLCRNPSGTWAASAHLPSGKCTAVTYEQKLRLLAEVPRPWDRWSDNLPARATSIYCRSAHFQSRSRPPPPPPLQRAQHRPPSGRCKYQSCKITVFYNHHFKDLSVLRISTPETTHWCRNSACLRKG